MKTIRWGIIGCGDVCEVKSGPGFYKASHSALVAVMRRDAAKAQDFARRHNVPRWYADADRLIADPEVDAVYIATPPGQHADYCLRAARAGKPVYVEKPMARSHDECQQMIGACRSAGVPLFVGYYRRCLPRFVKVRELVSDGAIGNVRFASVQLYYPPEKGDLNPAALPWRVQPEQSGGGRFLDLASHTLDLLDHVLGPVSTVSGLADNQGGLYPAEDIVTGTWRYASGAHGAGVWCFTAGARQDLVEIVGTKGRLRFSTFGPEPVELATDGGVQSFDIPHPPHVHQPLIQTIVNQLNGVGTCPSTGETAARTSWVMDQMLSHWRRRQSKA